MNVMDGLIVIVVVTVILELFIYQVSHGVFLHLLKACFYCAFAWMIYMISKTSDISLNDPQDWLTIMTFSLALFEAAHNVLDMVHSFSNKD